MFSIDKYFDISQCNNLLDIHIFLKQKNWSLNYDYLSRFSETSNCLHYIYNYEKNILLSKSLNLKSELILFLFREPFTDSLDLNKKQLEIIQQDFEIIFLNDLDNNTKDNLMLKTRGGNW